MSMSSSRRSISITNWRSGEEIHCSVPSGKPASAYTAVIRSTRARLLLIVSLPPRKMTAFPVFRHSAAMSMVAPPTAREVAPP